MAEGTSISFMKKMPNNLAGYSPTCRRYLTPFPIGTVGNDILPKQGKGWGQTDLSQQRNLTNITPARLKVNVNYGKSC